MVKIDRCPVAPASLAVESRKQNGSYREADVIMQLAHDFHEKCYICEIKPVQDPQVEHRLPHFNRSISSRVFDWKNLFYSCGHCNSIKNDRKYDRGIIDCCERDPEELLAYEVMEKGVNVIAKNADDQETVLTAELIEEAFNTTSTGIRTEAAQVRLRELQSVMNTFYKQLEKYKRRPDDIRTTRTILGFLDRSAKYSGFTRSYVKEHNWSEFLNDNL